jgi:hypothetical protein
MTILFCRCAIIFDMVDDQARYRIVANEGSHGGDKNRDYVIHCILDNELFWIEKSTLTDIIYRRGFPVVEAQRIQSETIADQANLVTCADFAARPFMDRPVGEQDQLNVLCWVEASEYNWTMPAEDQDPEWAEAAKEECYRESPYGKRFAVHQRGRNPADFPMKEFTHEDEHAYAAYVESIRLNYDVRGRKWDLRSAGLAQMLFIQAWNKGQVLLPLPLVDLEPEQAHFAQRRVELRQTRVDAEARAREAHQQEVIDAGERAKEARNAAHRSKLLEQRIASAGVQIRKAQEDLEKHRAAWTASDASAAASTQEELSARAQLRRPTELAVARGVKSRRAELVMRAEGALDEPGAEARPGVMHDVMSWWNSLSYIQAS